MCWLGRLFECVVMWIMDVPYLTERLTFDTNPTRSQDDHFPFILCVETLVYEGKYLQWESCFRELGMDPEPVLGCYQSEYGNKVSLLLYLNINIVWTLNMPPFLVFASSQFSYAKHITFCFLQLGLIYCGETPILWFKILVHYVKCS